MPSLVIGDIREKSSQEMHEISKSEQKALFGGCPGELPASSPFDRRRVQLH
jgi:hypothetical protein